MFSLLLEHCRNSHSVCHSLFDLNHQISKLSWTKLSGSSAPSVSSVANRRPAPEPTFPMQIWMLFYFIAVCFRNRCKIVPCESLSLFNLFSSPTFLAHSYRVPGILSGILGTPLGLRVGTAQLSMALFGAPCPLAPPCPGEEVGCGGGSKLSMWCVVLPNAIADHKTTEVRTLNRVRAE